MMSDSDDDDLIIGELSRNRTMEAIEKDGFREGFQEGRDISYKKGYSVGYKLGYELNYEQVLKHTIKWMTEAPGEPFTHPKNICAMCPESDIDRFNGLPLETIIEKQKSEYDLHR